MNTIYVGIFRYTPMITSQIRNVSVATDEGPSMFIYIYIYNKYIYIIYIYIIYIYIIYIYIYKHAPRDTFFQKSYELSIHSFLEYCCTTIIVRNILRPLK